MSFQENRQDCDDVCVICFTDRLGAAPCIQVSSKAIGKAEKTLNFQLECGHLFHYNCLKTVLTNRWNGPRIQFRFMNCPLCNRQVDFKDERFFFLPEGKRAQGIFLNNFPFRTKYVLLIFEISFGFNMIGTYSMINRVKFNYR